MSEGMINGQLPETQPVDEEPIGEERIFVATQWQLIWWKFRRHKIALASAIILILIYLMSLTCEFLAPYDPLVYDKRYFFAPPQKIGFVTENGFTPRPVVYGYTIGYDENMLRVYKPDPKHAYPIYLFVKGNPYKMWGLIKTNIHLFGIKDPNGTMCLLGTDRLGRDMLSRTLYGLRLSTSIGLVGVFLSFVLGILIGGFSGYYGGFFDTVVQRIIEFVICMPQIPLWMGLSAALPPHWPAVRVYFGITIILSLVGWTGLARVVRSKFLALREEDFVMSARLIGASEMRIVLKHMVPSFLSHIIASITMSVPGMILAETALSFLGLGLRPPAVSWGVLLQDAQNIKAVAQAPWLLIPGIFVVVTVLAFNFLGDGIRDAADPYAR
jgi:peptide/nickel transport system permease protein